ncbi:hypothetical protein ACFWA4_39890 [Streptomyces sp. NPDC060011]|uniref:hypothetical protein n=1 Tax=Streptomyces sp. NPDC060011 TaxID=3347037 RepID=UPI0036847EAB
MEAFEAAYVPALVRLLADDVVLEMPPVPLWYQSSRDYDRFMERVFTIRGMGGGMRMLTAGGQPALAAYAPQPGGVLRLHTLQVFTAAASRTTSCSPVRGSSTPSSYRAIFAQARSAESDEWVRCSPVRTGEHRTEGVSS